MIIIIVFLDFLYIFLNTGGRGRLTEFFLGLLVVVGSQRSQVNVGIRTNISQLLRPRVELGGRRELRHGGPQRVHGEVVAETGGDGELLLLLLLHGGPGLGQLEAGEDRLGGSWPRGVAAELKERKLERDWNRD